MPKSNVAILMFLGESVRRNPSLVRTLSFWSALLGSTLSTCRYGGLRIAGFILLNIVGIGGFGVSYHRLANKLHVPLEPLEIIGASTKYPDFAKEEIFSVLWHGVFAVLGWFRIAKAIR